MGFLPDNVPVEIDTLFELYLIVQDENKRWDEKRMVSHQRYWHNGFTGIGCISTEWKIVARDRKISL